MHVYRRWTAAIAAAVVAAGLLVAPATAAVATVGAAPPSYPASVTVAKLPTPERVAGEDFNATSAVLARRTHPTATRGVVYLVNGSNVANMLAAAPAAYRDRAPILTVSATAISNAVWNEIVRLGPSKIVLVGTTASVGPAVEQRLAPYRGYWSISRVAGNDLRQVAVNLSKSKWTPGVGTVYLVNGDRGAEALAAAPIAARANAPLLYTYRDSLSAVTTAELKRLKPRNIVIIGGSGSISTTATTAVRTLLPTTKLTRINGANAYEVAKALSAKYTKAGQTLFVASAVNLKEGVAAVGLAAASGRPILLTSATSVGVNTAAEIKRVQPAKVVVLGTAHGAGQKVIDEIRGFTHQTEALRLVNALRGTKKVPALKPHASLNAVAAAWAREMAISGYRHNPRLTSQIPKNWRLVGENIAYSFSGTPVTDMQSQWARSPGHLKNMVNGQYTHFGYGLYQANGRVFGVQIFARY